MRWLYKLCITSNFIALDKEVTVRKSPRTTTEKGKKVSTEWIMISFPKQGGTALQFPWVHCHNSPELGSLIIEVCQAFIFFLKRLTFYSERINNFRSLVKHFVHFKNSFSLKKKKKIKTKTPIKSHRKANQNTKLNISPCSCSLKHPPSVQKSFPIYSAFWQYSLL